MSWSKAPMHRWTMRNTCATVALTFKLSLLSLGGCSNRKASAKGASDPSSSSNTRAHKGVTAILPTCIMVKEVVLKLDFETGVKNKKNLKTPEAVYATYQTQILTLKISSSRWYSRLRFETRFPVILILSFIFSSLRLQLSSLVYSRHLGQLFRNDVVKIMQRSA